MIVWLVKVNDVFTNKLIILVLPGLAWVASSGVSRIEVQSAAEEVDGGLEALPVSVAAGLPLDDHDLAVQPFGHIIFDSVAAEGQDVL